MQPPSRNRSIVQPHPLIVQLVGFQYHYFSLIFCPENSQLSPKIIEICNKWPIFSVLTTKKAMIFAITALHFKSYSFDGVDDSLHLFPPLILQSPNIWVSLQYFDGFFNCSSLL